MSVRNLVLASAVVSSVVVVTSLFAQIQEKQDYASEIRKLRQSYREALKEVVEISHQRYLQGSGSIDGLLEARIELAKAESTLAEEATDRISALKLAVEKLRELEAVLQERVKLGVGLPDELAKCTAARIHAEIILLEELQQSEER